MPSTGVADMTLLSQVTNEQIRDNLGGAILEWCYLRNRLG
jgi:hypothetical protein